MVVRTQNLDSVYEYDGSLIGLNNNIIISGFTGPSSGILVVQDDDNGRDWDAGEGATFNGEAAELVGTGTITVGVTLAILGTISFGTAVPVEVFVAGGSTYFNYRLGQPAQLLDGLASDILATPGINVILSTLGITDLTAYLEENAVLTYAITQNNPIPICFTAGTLIRTPRGEVVIDDLVVGDLVCTADNGNQEIRWIGQRDVVAQGDFAPIVFSEHSIGNSRTLKVSPQHRMLIGGWRAELMFGESEVLVPAKHLVNDKSICRKCGGTVRYIHLLFDRHEIIYAEGIPSESFHPGDVGLGTLAAGSKEEVFEIFPELRSEAGQIGHKTARRVLKSFEAKALQGPHKII